MKTMTATPEHAQYVKPGRLIQTSDGSHTYKEVGLVQGPDAYNGPATVIFKDFTTRAFDDCWESVMTYETKEN